MNIQQNKLFVIFVPAFLLAVTLLVAYSNTFHSPFFYDDYGYVIGYSPIEISSLSVDSLKNAALAPGKMRALPNISFAINNYLNGRDVFGFHLVNFLVHLAASITVYFLFLKILNNKFVLADVKNIHEMALLSAILWAVHPLHTNSVSYIIQRMTSMAALFFLISILFYAHGREAVTKTKQIYCFATALLAGFFAIFSKENALMLPVMIIGLELFFYSELRTKRDLLKVLLFVVGAGAFLAGVALVLRGELLFFLAGYAKQDFNLLERVLTEPRVIIFYLSLLALPLPSRLNLLHDFSISTSFVSPPQTLLAIITIVLFLGAIVWLYKKNRLASFALFWFLGNLLIESSVLPLALIFEHRTYLPSVFLFVSLVALGQQFIKKTHIFRFTLFTMIVAFTIFTWQRNQVWSNTTDFWSDIAQKSPNLSEGHLGLYFALKRKGKDGKAHQSLLMAFNSDHGNDKAMTNLVSTYMEGKKYFEAVKVLDQFLFKNQTAAAFISRAKAFAMLKQFNKTISDAEKAININPKSGLAWLIKGKALSSINQRKNALNALTQANNLGLKSASLYESIGEVYINSGKVDLAIHYFKEAIKINPDHAGSHYYLGLAYGKKGLKTESQKEMQKGLYLKNNPKKITRNPHNFL